MSVLTGASGNVTIRLNSEGERVFPCHCGAVHQGEYAAEDWAHHNCLHRRPLIDIGAEAGLPLRSYLACLECGQTFGVAM